MQEMKFRRNGLEINSQMLHHDNASADTAHNIRKFLMKHKHPTDTGPPRDCILFSTTLKSTQEMTRLFKVVEIIQSAT